MPSSRASDPIVLDTHVWVWFVEGDTTELSAEVVEELEEAARTGRLLVSAISVWEVAMLDTKGRLSFTRPVRDWVAAALAIPGIRLLDLSPEISVDSCNLPGNVHGDPADRILAASARVVGGTLATKDAKLLAYADEGALRAVDCRA